MPSLHGKTALPDSLPAELEHRISGLESGRECGDDFDPASLCWQRASSMRFLTWLLGFPSGTRRVPAHVRRDPYVSTVYSIAAPRRGAGVPGYAATSRLGPGHGMGELRTSTRS